MTPEQQAEGVIRSSYLVMEEAHDWSDQANMSGRLFDELTDLESAVSTARAALKEYLRVNPHPVVDEPRFKKLLRTLMWNVNRLLHFLKVWARQSLPAPKGFGFVGGARPKGSASNLPDPHKTGQRLPGQPAQLGFNLGGIKGGGGALGGAGGSYGGSGGSGGQSGQAGGSGGYGTGYGGGGGLGHDKAEPGGGPGPEPNTRDQGGPLPDPPQRGIAGGTAGDAAAQWEQSAQDTVKSAQEGASQLGQAAGDATTSDTGETGAGAAGEEAAAYLNSLSGNDAQSQPSDDPNPPDTGGGSGSPNPDDGTDESGRMRGLPRYVRRQADKFTGKGAVPAQTSLVYRLLAFSSQGLGEDGGGVNPRFFGADPSSDRSTGRGARASDPDGGGGASGLGYTVGATPVNGGDTIGGMQGPVDMSDQAGAAAITPTGPDPDNEWGAGGYNPHYQPAGYAWTPSSRGTAGGATRAAPAQRVSRVAAIRFK